VTFLTRIENKEMIQASLPVPGVKPEPFSWFKFLPMRNKRIKVQSLGFGHEK